MYKLYHHPASQHARRVQALLEVANLPYELKHIAFETAEHTSDEYKVINPNQQVPTLIDDDVKIHESNASLRYLCFKHGLDDWYPTDIKNRAEVEQWLDWGQCRLSPAVINIVLYTVWLPELDNKEAIKLGHDTMAKLRPILDAGLEGRDFLTGDKPTIADISIASSITQLAFAGASPTESNIVNWMKRVCEIPGVLVTLPIRDAA
ncbi:MAG: glutathione S-transferase family protein [Emcibacteraceae bacterium]|nr:glutathione S-transferase family protein [Emcibacteraceae bacterium]